MTTYARAVNAYVDSRRAGSNTDRLWYPASQADLINPEWLEMLRQYYEELDKLRQDWALEVLGRRMVESFYFHHLVGNNIMLTEWPERDRRSIKTLAKRVQVRLRFKKQMLWHYWEFNVKKGLLPLRWGPLQDHYMRLKATIERKYSFLGMFRLQALDKNRYFPTRIHEVLHGWRRWYPGQANLQVKVCAMSTPPEHRWKLRIFVTARDGTVLYTSLYDPTENYLRYCVDDWRNFGFPR